MTQKGGHVSEETKKILSEASKKAHERGCYKHLNYKKISKKSLETRKKNGNMTLSEERKKKISESVKRAYDEGRLVGFKNREKEIERIYCEPGLGYKSKRFHDRITLREMKKYEDNGYRCIPVGIKGVPIPDFIAIRGDKIEIVSGEIELGGNPTKEKLNNYGKVKEYYDDIYWFIRIKEKLK